MGGICRRHTEQLLALLRDHLLSDERLLAMLPLVQERMDRLDEFVAKTDFFFTGDLSVDVGALSQLELSELRPAFAAVVEQLDGVSEWTRDVLHGQQAFCEEQEWKRDLFMPVRIATTGTKRRRACSRLWRFWAGARAAPARGDQSLRPPATAFGDAGLGHL